MESAYLPMKRLYQGERNNAIPSPTDLRSSRCGSTACRRRLLASHYENNYGGAVRRLNAIRDELAALDPAARRAFG